MMSKYMPPEIRKPVDMLPCVSPYQKENAKANSINNINREARIRMVVIK